MRPVNIAIDEIFDTGRQPDCFELLGYPLRGVVLMAVIVPQMKFIIVRLPNLTLTLS